MQTPKRIVILFGLISILIGCQEGKNLTTPDALTVRQTSAPAKPSDDTSGSEVASPQYPAGRQCGARPNMV